MITLIKQGPKSSEKNIFQEGFKTKFHSTHRSPLASFLPEFKEISPRLWILRACDPSLRLECELFLEIRGNDSLFSYSSKETRQQEPVAPFIFCDYPSIDLQQLRDKVGGDAELEGLAMIGFQLQILEQLLLMGEDRGAENLILNFGEHTLDYLEIYRGFLISEEEVMTARGEQTQITIPVDVETYDQLLDLMDKVERDFQQALWRGQKTNPALRHYIKSQVVSRI